MTPGTRSPLRLFGLLLFFLLLCLALFCTALPAVAHEYSQESLQDLRAKITLTEAEKAWIAQRDTVRVRVAQWPPYMLTVRSASGIAVDFLDVVAKVHGIRFSYLTERDISWPEALRRIAEHRDVDLIPAIQRTPLRERYLAFTEPYQALPWVIVTRDDGEFIGGLEDLGGKRVSVQQRFVLQGELERAYPDIRLQVVDTPTPTLDSLKAVATGTADATINALPVVAYFINKHGLTNLKVAAPARIADLELSMGVRNDWPELASICTKTFAALGSHGRAAIRDRWVSLRYGQGVPFDTVLQWGLWGSLVVLVLLGVVSGANATLRRKVAQRTAELANELAERRKAEEALRESTRHVRNVVEYAPVPMALTSADGTVEYFNSRFEDAFGFSREELTHIDAWWNLAYPDPDYREKVQRTWTDAVARASRGQGEATVYEAMVTTRDGRRKDIEFHYMHAGTRGVTAFIDVTERNRSQEVLVQSEKMLSVGGLAAGMAHEINNPLGIVVQAMQVAQRRLSPEIEANRALAETLGIDLERLQEYLEQRGVTRYLDAVREAGLRAASITRNMLDFSRRSGEGRVPGDINAILDKALELAASDYSLHKRFDFKFVDIVREYAPGLPPVFVAEIEIEQVFLNIIKNAAEAMHGGERPPRLIVRSYAGEDGVCVDIEDNGPGLDEHERSRIFEPFYTTKAPGVGTGLGLSVSYFIITNHHKGLFTVRSVPGEGATFTVCLKPAA